MKTLIITGLFLFCFAFAKAQKSKKEDVEAIKSMCGCHEVSFNFAETFAPDEDYEFHENYRSGALELVLPIEETNDKIVLQHLLVIGDTMIIKHWRQDWIYENTDLYVYDKDNAWKYEELPDKDIKGTWTQKVYQVDDGLRYEGAATWVHVDGKHFWENETYAPMPRRERKRDDYNVMKRENRHEITADGWIHEQDNDKVLRREEDDKLIASEKGMNTYTKVDDSKCQVANEWWEENKTYWTYVREVWDELFAQKQDLAFEKKVDNQLLFQKLFALAEEPVKSEEAIKEKIRQTIQSYLKGDVKFAMK